MVMFTGVTGWSSYCVVELRMESSSERRSWSSFFSLDVYLNFLSLVLDVCRSVAECLSL